MNENYDKAIIGAGFYGLYSAIFCGKKGQKIIVFEKEKSSFSRASYINQARVHMGYHYPRSIATATKSAKYFERFCEEFEFCINRDFEQIYATSSNFTWTTRPDFKTFCKNAGIPCLEIDPEQFFKNGICDGAFVTKEYSYDAQQLKKWLLKEIEGLPNVTIKYECALTKIERKGDVWEVEAAGEKIRTPYILNAAYAGINEILRITDGGVFNPFKIKYEKCEIILCEVSDKLKNTGITVMDGPFFSIMPFGYSGLHSLTSVTFTPHETSYESFATFSCQNKRLEDLDCSIGCLGNCNDCKSKPESAWPYMSQLARKYLKDEYGFRYHSSLYSMKPILVDSEIDDSRPTVIRKHCSNPTLVSVLSGKINTVYDLDEVLLNG